MNSMCCSFAPPQRASRFFSLSLKTHLQSPLSQNIQQQHKKHMKIFEEKGALIMGYEQKADQNQKSQNANFYYFFQSPNEVEAFQFMKSSPFKNYIKNYAIEEIAMQPRMRFKQIAPRNLRE